MFWYHTNINGGGGRGLGRFVPPLNFHLHKVCVRPILKDQDRLGPKRLEQGMSGHSIHQHPYFHKYSIHVLRTTYLTSKIIQ